MPVKLLIDPWNPSYRYRFETFCYGPRSCTFYKAGAPRKELLSNLVYSRLGRTL